jgi:2-methylcitrate dehydratase PrpD
MEVEMATLSEELARFMKGLSFEQIPEKVVEKCKLHILDIMGIALASSQFDFGRSVFRAIQELGRGGPCTAIGFAGKYPPASAALLNGSLAHGLDFDDTHVASIVHCGASVIPTALAVGEETKADGKSILTAMVGGFEIVTRLGLAAEGKFHDRGFHPTSICGTISSSLIAGKLYGSSLEVLTGGIGISGTMASGLLEIEDSWLKRLHPGWAGHAGISASLLAKSGFKGPQTILEGRSGLFASHLHGDSYNLRALTKDLGKEWETLNIGFKPYPCCHFIHAFLDCAKLLREEHRLAPEEINRIDCLVSPRLMPIIAEPRAVKCRPPTSYAAQFSIPFTLAAMLVTGKVDVDTFGKEEIQNARILTLADRVFWEEDPESDYPRHFPGYVKISMKDGQSFERRERVNRGGPENPMSKEEVKEKFHKNAGKVISPEKGDRIVEVVERLEKVPRASLLMNYLNKCKKT